jgi:elongation factor Ts
MVQSSVDAIKDLRAQTGAGIMDCKRALEEVGGDTAKAYDLLRERGVALASKKAARDTKEGVVDSYIHSGSKVGAIIELSCETDFVARTPEFKELAHDLAMQIAAMAPTHINSDALSDKEVTNQQEVCLLDQTFIKDQSKTIRELINDMVARVGENVVVRRFQRFALGE